MQQAHPLQGLDYKHMTRQLATEASFFEADSTSRGRLTNLIEEQVGYQNSAAAQKHFLESMGQACVGN